MTWLEWIAVGWFGLCAIICGWLWLAAELRDRADLRRAMLRRLDSHPREAIRNPEDAWRRAGGL